MDGAAPSDQAEVAPSDQAGVELVPPIGDEGAAMPTIELEEGEGMCVVCGLGLGDILLLLL